MSEKTNDITLLCKVVDNFGDIGVVYRLARALEELNQEHECHPISLRLIVDNLEAFHSIEPAIKTNLQYQELNSIKIFNWNATEFCHEEFKKNPPEIILECFQCGRPEWMEKLLFDEGLPETVHIIMIDYLTAEDYAETFHCLMSLTRSAKVEKVNFMPGFTSKTGGLILDKAFMESLAKADKTNAGNKLNYTNAGKKNAGRRENSDSDKYKCSASLKSEQNSQFNVVFFTYEKDWTPAVKALESFKSELKDKELNVLVAQGRGHDSFIQAWEQSGRPFKIKKLDFLRQCAWDELLCNTPLLFIRGEDSLSRACLIGHPFVWQAYPQSDEYQTVKVKALLEKMRPFFIPEDFNCIEEVFLAFNIPEGDIEGTLRNFLRNYGKLCDGFKKFALNLQKNGNLAKNLMTFIEKSYIMK